MWNLMISLISFRYWNYKIFLFLIHNNRSYFCHLLLLRFVHSFARVVPFLMAPSFNFYLSSNWKMERKKTSYFSFFSLRASALTWTITTQVKVPPVVIFIEFQVIQTSFEIIKPFFSLTSTYKLPNLTRGGEKEKNNNFIWYLHFNNDQV